MSSKKNNLIEIDLSNDLLTMEGQSIPKFDAANVQVGTECQADILRQILNRQVKGADPIKVFYWGSGLYKDKKIRLEKADLTGLETMIREDEGFVLWAKGQIIETLREGVKQAVPAE